MEHVQSMAAEENGGTPMPVWNTEFGYRGTGPIATGNVTQAQYLVRSHAMTKAAGVEKLNWYRFKARRPGHDRGGNGLIRAESHPYGP
jgi:hypothetical protein